MIKNQMLGKSELDKFLILLDKVVVEVYEKYNDI